MTVTTKAGLAAELGILKARVSQYLKRGLPELANGKIEREVAVKWINENFPSYGRERATGVKRAGEIAKAVKRKPAPLAGPAASTDDAEPDAVDNTEDRIAAAMWDAVTAIITRSGEVADRMAIEAGTSVAVAYSLDIMVAVALADVAERFLIKRDVEPFASGAFVIEALDSQTIKADWPALAKAAGEDFDQDACDAFHDALPWAQQGPAAVAQVIRS